MENGTLRVDGQTYTTGLGLNAKCTLVYNLPEGHNYVTFRTLCGYDSSCDTDNPNSTGTTMEFLIYAVKSSNNFTVDLTQLGYGANESVPLHDIWAEKDLDPVTGTLTATVPSHGARLFRLGDNTPDKIEGVISDRNTINSLFPADVFDLNGMLLKQNASSIDNLPKGLYIIGGKKVYKK